MTASGKAGPAHIPLHERMEARGAKKHRRKSSLSRFMIERAAEMRRLIEVDRYSWKDIAAMLSEDEGLTDNKGNPVTEVVARITWSRVRAGRAAKAKPAQQAVIPPSVQPEEPTSQIADVPFATPSPERVQLDIRPASLRAATTKATEKPVVSLLNDTEMRQRVSDVATRQGGLKIPPAKVL